MIIALEEVVFDHAKGSAANDAISLRKDRTTTAPPWTRSVNGGGAPSLAAYAIKPTRNRTITIHAKFSMNAFTSSTVSIRARMAGGSSTVLGHVAAKTVAVPANGSVSGAISMTLTTNQISTLGVGRYPVVWTWQFRLTANDPWVDFDSSHHIVYVVLDVPGPPWAQNLIDTADQPWPWATVLDWACCWAQGIRSSSAAVSKRVTERIHLLGGQLATRPGGTREPIGYDGFSTYVADTGHVFFCSAFLSLLSSTTNVVACAVTGTVAEREPVLNCTDCATAVVTFANSLGASLSIHCLSIDVSTNFRLNKHWLFGETEPQSDADILFDEWSYHEIAHTSGNIYDAALKLDGDARPEVFPCEFEMPLGWRFEGPSSRSRSYRRQLVATADRVHCQLEAVPHRRIDHDGSVTVIRRGLLDTYRGEIERSVSVAVSSVRPLPSDFTVDGYEMAHRDRDPVFLVLLGAIKAVEWHYRSRDDPKSMVTSAVAAFAKPMAAQEALARLLTTSETRLILDHRHGGHPTIGDVSFTLRDDAAIVFVRDNILVRLRGRNATGVLRRIAQQLDSAVLR